MVYACKLPFSNIIKAFKKQPDSEVDLNLDLLELYHGTKKRWKTTKRVVRQDGTVDPQEKIHEVVIKPGYKAGTKIRFRAIGNDKPGYLPADVVFIIKEKPHNIFKRDGDNVALKSRVLMRGEYAVQEIEDLDTIIIHSCMQ